MLGQSDVTEARMIDQALVASSPRSGVYRFGCRRSFEDAEKRAGSEEDALPGSFERPVWASFEPISADASPL
jgi:hypothetical protein